MNNKSHEYDVLMRLGRYWLRRCYVCQSLPYQVGREDRLFSVHADYEEALTQLQKHAATRDGSDPVEGVEEQITRKEALTTK